MTIKKTHEAELDGVRYIKERDILVAPPPPLITLQMICMWFPFKATVWHGPLSNTARSPFIYGAGLLNTYLKQRF